MFSLLGAPALSQFRLDQAAALAAGAAIPGSVALASRLVHFVDAARPLDESDLELLGKLLTYGPRPHAAGASAADAPGDAALGHGIAMVEQGHRHRPCLRPRRRAPPRTGHGVFHRCRARRSSTGDLRKLAALLHDRMTESVWLDRRAAGLFLAARAAAAAHGGARARDGQRALARANHDWGLALSARRDRLFGRRVPHARARPDRRRAHDVRASELRALPAQDIQRRLHRRRRAMPASLFAMIRATYARNSHGVLSAYRDNAAVIEGAARRALLSGSRDRRYGGARSRSTS